MLTQEQFVKEVLESFKAIRADISKKHGETNKKIEDLCQKYIKLHEQINTHLKIEEKLEEYRKEQKNAILDQTSLKLRQKNTRFYIIFGITTAIFAAYSLFKELM